MQSDNWRCYWELWIDKSCFMFLKELGGDSPHKTAALLVKVHADDGPKLDSQAEEA